MRVVAHSHSHSHSLARSLARTRSSGMEDMTVSREKCGRADQSETESGTDVDVHKDPKGAKAARERLVRSVRIPGGNFGMVQTVEERDEDGTLHKTLHKKEQ